MCDLKKLLSTIEKDGYKLLKEFHGDRSSYIFMDDSGHSYTVILIPTTYYTRVEVTSSCHENNRRVVDTLKDIRKNSKKTGSFIVMDHHIIADIYN